MAAFVAAFAGAFALGARTRSGPAPASPSARTDDASGARAPLATSAAAPPAWPAWPSRSGAPPAAAPAMAPQPKLTPELVDRVTQQARDGLEALRATLVARCAPEGSRDAGAHPATLVVNLTFDADGREIARGIAENRRAPAGRLGTCLRRLRDTSLSVAPPGVTVGVSVPITLP